jgi:hypothetical protein
MQKQAEDPMRPINVDDGRMLLNTLGGGLALGAGAVGIHQLLKQLRSRMRRKPPAEENIYQSVYSSMPTKQADGKTTYEDVLAAIGRTFMPKQFPSISAPGEGGTEAVSPMHWAARTIIPAATGVAGAGLGAMAVKNIVSSRQDAARNRDAAQSVAAARKHYFDALLNNEEADDEKKATVDEKLTELYKQTKQAEETGQRSWYNPMRYIGDYLYEPGVGLPIALGMGSLGVGGLYGGVLAYKRRKAESQRKANATAEEARARLRGISPPWIDPQELAALKQVNEKQDA